MKKYLKHLITFIIGLIMFLIILISKNIFSQTDKLEIYKILSDAALLPAIVLGGMGLIIFVDNHGAFDMIIYGVKLALSMFKRRIERQAYKSYYEYQLAKHETSNPFGFLLINGGFFLLLSVIFLICYLNI